LFDTLTVRADAGADKRTCDNNPVQLGVPPEPGRVYKWTPVTGLSNPNISNPIATPSVSTLYTLTVTNNGGGCSTPDQVNVNVDILSDSLELIGVNSYCKGSGKSAALKVLPHDSIQWFKDNVPIPGPVGHQQVLNITQSGAYYAMVFSFAGCNRTTAVKQIDIWDQPIADFIPSTFQQCDIGNQFVFTNKSTLATGTPQYDWDLGDGSTSTLADVTHSYAKPGNYTVKLKVTAPGGCTDFHSIDVLVNPSPVSAFAVDEPIQCFKDNWFVFSNKSTVSTGVLTYTWDFGDGNMDYSNDIAHHYAIAGTYSVKLTAKETNGGCSSDSIFKVLVNQSPITDFAIDNNIQCFPGHQFVLTNNTTILSDTLLYTWDMGDGIIKTAKDFTYSYAKAGNYTIKLMANTLGGCSDSITRNVIVHPTPTADFSVRSVCENLQVPIINRTYNNTTSTINYMWDFDNGHTDNVMTPRYSYPSAGTYALKLTVSTAQCPVSFDSKTVYLNIDGVTPGIVYPDKDAAYNYAEPLQARQLGNSVIWDPPVSLSNRFSFSPIFIGMVPQLYTIKITTATGCITVDTQLVKTHKKIEIFVPNSFTPGGDGKNDKLRPILIGFTKVNYFRVFNRWGKLLFSMNNDQPGWDGNVNGQPADTQTVIWMIEAVDVDGVVHSKQGTTVLFR
jgi:gliding motility-associated-like protein